MIDEGKARVVAKIMEIRDACDEVLEMFCAVKPSGDCSHPPDKIEDVGSFGEDEYRCTACGVTQPTPFHPQGD